MFCLGIFAAISLLFKLALLALVDASKLRSRTLYFILFLLAIQNTCEAVGFFLLGHGSPYVNALVDLYLIAAYFLCAAIFIVSLQQWIEWSWKTNLLYLVPAFFATAHINGLLVDGYVFQGFALIRSPAEWSEAVDVFFVFTCFFGALIPLKTGHSWADRWMAMYALSTLLVAVLQAVGYQATSAIVQPVITIGMSYCLFMEARSKNGFRVSGFFYRNWKGLKALNKPGLTLVERREAFDSAIIGGAMIQAQKKQKDAALIVGTTPSNLNKIIKKAS